MFYRDYMQKFRPLMGPDGPAGGEGGDAAAAAAGAAAQVPDASSAAPAAGEAAAAAPAATEAAAAESAAPAAAAPEPKSETQPSLIESAQGKPKPDAEAAKPAEGEAKPDPAKDAPAPAEAAKPDATDAKPDADKAPEPAKETKDAAEATDPAKDATAAAQPPAPIKYEAFKVPDGIKLEDDRVGKFAEIAGPARVSQEVAQKFMDLHVEEIQRVTKDIQQAAVDNQRKVWNTYIDTITSELRKDPELGGNRLETSLSMAKAVVEEYLPANEAAEYLALLSHNGMGNHRLQVKLLHAIGDKLNIFEDGLVPANPQAPRMQKSPGNRGWYDKTPGGGAA